LSLRDRRRLEKLSALARSKEKSHPGFLVLPQHALRIEADSPIAYAGKYFGSRIRAPFMSPLAADYDIVVEAPARVEVSARPSYDELQSAIADTLLHYHLYLSNYLTHPRYGPADQIGFCRGDTLRPLNLREVSPGVYEFTVSGVLVGRRDMLARLKGPTLDVHAPAPPTKLRPLPAGWERIFFTMPTKPDSPQVGDGEWYDFLPHIWKRDHPNIPLVDPAIAVRVRPRTERDLIAPDYEALYRRGRVNVAFLFGYDFEGGHNTTKDAKAAWEVLVAPAARRFTVADTGQYGYHGPGFGFSDPTEGQFSHLSLRGDMVFKRGPGLGSGPMRVRYHLRKKPLSVGGRDAPAGSVLVGGKQVKAGTVVPVGKQVERDIAVDVRLLNFDKSSARLTSQQLIDQFVAVFKDNEIVIYDGHANYGGGFFVGQHPIDILWAVDIGSYVGGFSSRYQIVQIGACHSAGYFADLFYNELRPRKTPANMDIIAAVNETAFDDAVHQSMGLLRGLLQHEAPQDGEPPSYERILNEIGRRAEFQAYIGVFGKSRGTEAVKTTSS
jgi:hypothetical protein